MADGVDNLQMNAGVFRPRRDKRDVLGVPLYASESRTLDDNAAPECGFVDGHENGSRLRGRGRHEQRRFSKAVCRTKRVPLEAG
jgi:hypothetical protein